MQSSLLRLAAVARNVSFSITFAVTGTTFERIIFADTIDWFDDDVSEHKVISAIDLKL